jgi:hypothetical protein
VGTQVACLGLDASNNVVKNAAACGAGGGGTPGGSNTQLQFNNAGSFGGIAGATTNGTVVTFATNDLSLAGATSGNTLLNATAAAGAGTVATFPANTGIVAELNLAQTFSAVQTFSASNGIVYSGAAVGTQVSCLGLDASNNVVKNAAACGSGGGGTPGGANTNVQFNNSGAFGGDAGFTYTTLGQVTIAGGTITTNNKALTITQTWNNNATTFDAPLFMNITNTASANLSYLADFQLNGASVFNVFNNAGATLTGITANAPSSTNTVIQLQQSGATQMRLIAGNAPISVIEVLSASTPLQIKNTGGTVGSDILLSVGPGGGGIAASPANQKFVVAPTGNTAGAFWVYNTTDSNFAPTNFERAVFDWTTTANVLTIGSQAGGTGTGRQVILVSAGLYSAAGVALPTCAAGIKGAQAVVSDATAPTYNANYTSGGAVVAHVVCNGTNWVTQ